MGNRETAIKNLKKGWKPGPGRKKMTEAEKLKVKDAKEYMKLYLSSGEAVKDFERARTKQPLQTFQEAANRTYGTAKSTLELSGSVSLSAITIIHETKKDE